MAEDYYSYLERTGQLPRNKTGNKTPSQTKPSNTTPTSGGSEDYYAYLQRTGQLPSNKSNIIQTSISDKSTPSGKPISTQSIQLDSGEIVYKTTYSSGESVTRNTGGKTVSIPTQTKTSTQKTPTLASVSEPINSNKPEIIKEPTAASILSDIRSLGFSAAGDKALKESKQASSVEKRLGEERYVSLAQVVKGGSAVEGPRPLGSDTVKRETFAIGPVKTKFKGPSIDWSEPNKRLSDYSKRLERLQRQEEAAGERIQRSVDIFRAVPGLKGDSTIQKAGRYVLATPGIATVGFAEQLSLGIQKGIAVGEGLTIKETRKAALTEIRTAGIKTPGAVLESYKPKVENIPNYILTAFAVRGLAKARANSRATTPKSGSVKPLGTRSFPKGESTVVVEKGTFTSKSGQLVRYDIRTTFNKGSQGKGVYSARLRSAKTGKVIGTGKGNVNFDYDIKPVVTNQGQTLTDVYSYTAKTKAGQNFRPSRTEVINGQIRSLSRGKTPKGFLTKDIETFKVSSRTGLSTKNSVFSKISNRYYQGPVVKETNVLQTRLGAEVRTVPGQFTAEALFRSKKASLAVSRTSFSTDFTGRFPSIESPTKITSIPSSLFSRPGSLSIGVSPSPTPMLLSISKPGSLGITPFKITGSKAVSSGKASSLSDSLSFNPSKIYDLDKSRIGLSNVTRPQTNASDIISAKAVDKTLGNTGFKAGSDFGPSDVPDYLSPPKYQADSISVPDTVSPPQDVIDTFNIPTPKKVSSLTPKFNYSPSIPFFLPVIFPGGGGSGRRRKFKIPSFRTSKYQPSVIGSVFKIKGSKKKRKGLTGFEIRGLRGVVL